MAALHNDLFTLGAHNRGGEPLIMSDEVNGQDGPPERRRAPRAALRLSATIREPGRSRTQVRVIDISVHGCRIEATSGPSPDSWVLLSIAGLETQYSHVVWQCHEFAGLEFTTPISELVLESLLQNQKQLSESAIGELRDIANRTHRLATQQGERENARIAEFSRKCALDAVVEGLRLGEGASPRRAAPNREPPR